VSRQKRAIRPIEKNLSFSEDLVARVDLLLYSELEGRVPYGAWSKLVQALLEKMLEEREKGK